MEKKKIIIAGDTVPTSSNFDLFSQEFSTKNNNVLFDDGILNAFASADYSILNLETPLCDKKNPIKKSGPALCAPESCAEGLKNLGVKLCSLSNNHILDQGNYGLEATKKALSEKGISFSGAGSNIRDAEKAHVFELKCENEKAIRVGVYFCCEHEFTCATESSSGANPFDPFESFDYVQEVRKNLDYLIVLFHGGKEFYRYPSPLLQKTCRKFIDKGADLVLCQHSHCIGCEENYRGKKILYGQGNFIFDSPDSYLKCWETGSNSSNSSEGKINLSNPWNSGLLVEVELSEDKGEVNADINYVPVVKINNKVRLADESEKSQILDEFFKRSKEIENADFVKENFARFSKEKFSSYASTFMGKQGSGFVFKVLNKLLKQKLRENNYSQDGLLSLKNAFQCESHREVVLSALEEKIHFKK